MRNRLVTAGFFCCLLASVTLAGDTPLYDLSQFPVGVYKMTVTTDGVQFESLTIITPTIGGNPTPNPTGLSQVVSDETAKIPASQTKDLLASSLSIVCGQISADLKSGLIDKGFAADRWNQALKLLDGEQSWAAWKTAVTGKLGAMQLNDELETEAQWSTAFGDISKNLVAGNAGLGDVLAKLKALFEGLDPEKLAKWIEIIKLLISIFAGS